MVQPLFEYSPSQELMGSSPKTLITLFLLGRYNHYLDKMDKPHDLNLDTATAALIATLPDKTIRNKIWDDYLAHKEQRGEITAAILASGEWFAQICDVLEFTEKSTGAF